VQPQQQQQSFVQQPQAGYPPNIYGQPGGAPAAEAPKPRSKRGLWIAIGGVVAIGAGVGIAVGVSGGGKKAGAASRDEVVTGTLTALGAGDADALYALMSPDAQKDQLECETDAGSTEIDRALKAVRGELVKSADKAKGLAIELVKTTDGKTQVVRKGSPLGGCKLKVDVTSHELQLVLKIKKGDVSRERTRAILLTEVDGRWFLSNPPAVEPPGDCTAAAKTTAKNGREVYAKRGLGDTGLARIEKAFAKHCVDDDWSDEVILCFTEAKDDAANTQCIAKMPQSTQDKLVNHLRQILVEDLKSREVPVVTQPATPVTPPPAPGDPTAPPGPAGAGSAAPVIEEIPPICNDYLAELEKLTKCRRVKARIREGHRKEYDLIVEGWQAARNKDAIRESTEKLCKRGVDQVLDLRKSQCR
jgi:hypothetical protein